MRDEIEPGEISLRAHGVPSPPPMDGTDGWTDWRDTYVLWQGGERNKYSPCLDAKSKFQIFFPARA